jgi:hypothetical protein
MGFTIILKFRNEKHLECNMFVIPLRRCVHRCRIFLHAFNKDRAENPLRQMRWCFSLCASLIQLIILFFSWFIHALFGVFRNQPRLVWHPTEEPQAAKPDLRALVNDFVGKGLNTVSARSMQ